MAAALRKLRDRSTIKKAALTALMLAFAVVVLLPFLFMISTSLKSEMDIHKYPVEWIPSRIVNNYSTVWSGKYQFHVYYFNSIKVTSLTLLGLILTSSLAAYGFSRIRFRGRDSLFLLYLSTIMIPDEVTLIPKFILFKYLGLNDTHAALIFPAIFNVIGVFLMRQFMLTVPMELSEAAKIDGAGEFGIWRRIFLPLTKPAMITLAVVSVIWSWNDFMKPLIFLKSVHLYTIPLGLIQFIEETGKLYTLITAASVSATLPPILLFLLGQRFVIEGITSGAIKG